MKARKIVQMLFAVALSLLFISVAISVNAEAVEMLQINETLSFTGLGTPVYFESLCCLSRDCWSHGI